MSKKSTWLYLSVTILLIITAIIAWRLISSEVTQAISPATTPTITLPQEQPITIIPLSGPIAESKSEISGMAWYQNTLILLPQYPSRFGPGDGAVFALAKDDILAFIDGTQSTSLTTIEIPFFAPGIEHIDGFEGFEAIAFSGNQTYLTIEAKPDQMMGYLVIGTINPDVKEIRLDTTQLIEIPPQAQIDNMTDEALLVTSDGVFSFFEANGRKNNPSPIVHAFAFSGETQSHLPMVNLEYRLTDVSSLDEADRFWGINYFYPGDTKLTPDSDPLVEIYGKGPTHVSNTTVERLVQFQYSHLGITFTDTPPIQLQLLSGDEARNWEAIAYLDRRGFLIATDKFPGTILAFVGMP